VQSNVDIVGLWIHQESGGTFYHHFYYVDKQLCFDTFQVTYPNRLGVTLRSSEIKWDGKTLKTTQVAPSGFTIRMQLKIRGDLLEGSVSANNDTPGEITLRKMPGDIAEKEIANLKQLGAQLGSR
jgi:hypothetical protein